MKVTDAKQSIVRGPAIHPSLDMLHASDSTPDPITPVIICAKAVHTFPELLELLTHICQLGIGIARMNKIRGFLK